jgi:copper transport protein
MRRTFVRIASASRTTPMTRTLRNLAVVVGIVASIIALTAGVAAAHAGVLGTSPVDGQSVSPQPQNVSVSFSEDVSTSGGGLNVRNADGTRVDDGTSVVTGGTVLITGLKPGLPDGTYVATYRVLSADGHPVSGSFLFGIGAGAVDTSAGSGTSGDRIWQIVGGISRFVMYLAALLAAGVAFFLAFIHDQLADRWKIVPVVRIGSVVAMFGAVGIVVSQAALLTGRGAGAALESAVLRDVLTKSLGWSLVVLLLGLAAVHLSTDTDRILVVRALALYGGLAVTISFAVWGHASELSPRWVSLIADAVHATAAALWLGGLVGLAMVLRRRRAGTIRSTATIIDRFSSMALITVIALTIAGLALTLTGSGASWHALVSTTWGRLLLIKIAITLVVVGLAAWNRRTLVPALTAPIESDEQGEPIEPSDIVNTDADIAADTATDADADPELTVRWRQLLRTVRIEAIALVVVIGITAALVNTTPARTAVKTQTHAVDINRSADTGSVHLIVSPAVVGVNTMTVTYADTTGQPLDVANTMTVEFSLPSADLAPITRQVVKSGPGRFVLQGRELSLAGTWTVTLAVRTGDFTEQRTSFEVPITR